jgi:NADH-quinone oxidoreductase subunit L
MNLAMTPGSGQVDLGLIVLMPFFGFLACLLLGRWLPKALAGGIACLSVLVSFGLSLVTLFDIQEGGPVTGFLFPWKEWIDIPGLGAAQSLKVSVDFGLTADHLSCVMILVVTGVGFLIHLYSTGYMWDDRRFARYMAYLNFFTGFMLLLVLSDNLLGMFIGWEGVGLCSYLLIGFWFDDRKKGLDNSRAGMKAFVVNRIGDFGFTIGVLMLFTYVGASFGIWTLDFAEIRDIILANRGYLDGAIVFTICCLLFMGATAKSAQIPLYVWLPDAMAGPTPVSALIHAATMVTAGVYMCCRMGFLFDQSVEAQTVVAVVGGLTAVFSALIGFAQNDIKKVLAYSTVSQLGFMFMAVGVGAYWVAIFHVMTHAFFKACLFLGSGSVIMGCHHEQDVRKMGGLRKLMPLTYWTFFISWLAIAGVPGLSGFFSKDEILWVVFSGHLPFGLNYAVYGLGIAGAFCTAFYMTRLMAKTFWGEFRSAGAVAHSGGGVEHAAPAHHEEEHEHHPSGPPHESPWQITLPLAVLAGMAIVGGYVGLPRLWTGHASIIEEWLHHSFAWQAPHVSEYSHGVEWTLMALSVAVGALGIWLAWKFDFHKAESKKAEEWARRNDQLYQAALNKFYVDEIYEATVLRGVLSMNQACARFDNEAVDGLVNLAGDATDQTSHVAGIFDNEVIDGMVNGVADGVMIAGRNFRRAQTGNIRAYLTFAVLAALGLIAIFSVWFHWAQIKDLFGK